MFRELAARRYAADQAAPIAERALATFETALREAYAQEPVAEVEGATAALGALRAAGIKLGLTSGFDRGLVAQLTERLGLASLFDVILAAEDVPIGRPAPYLIYRAMLESRVQDVGRVAVIGDTPLDLQAGMNARAGWVIGVLSGAHGIERLGATPHTHLLPSIASVPAVFGLASGQEAEGSEAVAPGPSCPLPGRPRHGEPLKPFRTPSLSCRPLLCRSEQPMALAGHQ